MAVLLVSTLAGCVRKRDSHVEELMLPSGDTLINDTYVSVGFHDSSRVNRYFIVFRGTKKREFIGQNYATDGLLEGNDSIQQLRNGERVAVIIGHSVFKRWERQGKPWWYEWSGSDVDSLMFLRSFSTNPPPGDAKSGDQWFDYPHPNKFPYRVKTVDLHGNTMVLCATSAVDPWPTNLVLPVRVTNTPGISVSSTHENSIRSCRTPHFQRT
jgi:hypothetical protein